MASPVVVAPNNPIQNEPNIITPERLWKGIKTVAKVAFAILLSAGLFAINPGISLISFVVGVAFNDVIQKAVDKIRNFIAKHPIIVSIGAIVMAIVALPVFIATVTVIWNAHLGNYLSREIQG